MPTIVDVSTVVLSSCTPNCAGPLHLCAECYCQTSDQDHLLMGVVIDHPGTDQNGHRRQQRDFRPSAVASQIRTFAPRWRVYRPPITAPTRKLANETSTPLWSTGGLRGQPEPREKHSHCPSCSRRTHDRDQDADGVQLYSRERQHQSATTVAFRNRRDDGHQKLEPGSNPVT